MYRTIADFKKEWEVESDATLKVLRALTDESLNQRVDADGRSLGRLAWHLVQTIPEMMTRTGLSLDKQVEEEPQPAEAAQIAHRYEQISNALLEQVLTKWNDASLLEEDDMYGQTWPRGETLLNLQTHQTHHRGQMTVLMRQAGLRVPGFYGPAREDWASMGMPAMA